jgi:hypothetical protein
MIHVPAVMQLLALTCAAALAAAGCAPEPGTANIPPGNTETANDEPRLVNENWQVIRMGTAHGSLVVEVEAADPTDAPAIAKELTEPVRDRYDEVLVYVARLGDRSGAPVTRIQWTRQHGYVETRGAER